MLKALDEAGVPVDCVAGTSIGALVGAIYTMGDLEELEAFLRALDRRKLLSYFDFVFPRSGLLDGERIYELISRHVTHTRLEEARIPFCAVACDLASGREVLFRTGDVVEAVRASVSLPGILTPVWVDGTFLVDGGLVNPVPVDVVRRMGAEVVIAVDLNHDFATRAWSGRGVPEDRATVPEQGLRGAETDATGTQAGPSWPGEAGARILQALEQRYQHLSLSMRRRLNRWIADTRNDPTIFDVISASIGIMSKRITEANLRIHPPDVLVRPAVGHLGLFDFARAAEAIEEGYARMVEAMPEVLRRLERG